MHGTTARDGVQPLTLRLVDVAGQHDVLLDQIDLAVRMCLASGALGGGDSLVAQFDRQLAYVPALSLGIQPNRDGRSGAEGRQQQLVGSHALIVSRIRWLVGHDAMLACRDGMGQPVHALDSDGGHG